MDEPYRCRKFVHETSRAARIIRKKYIAKNGDGGRTLEVYYCLECKGWHLGHPSKWQKARRRDGQDYGRSAGLPH